MGPRGQVSIAYPTSRWNGRAADRILHPSAQTVDLPIVGRLKEGSPSRSRPWVSEGDRRARSPAAIGTPACAASGARG